MRKFLAGKLIRLAHLIYPPKVEEMLAGVKEIVFADGSSMPFDPMPPERRESRGWN